MGMGYGSIEERNFGTECLMVEKAEFIDFKEK